MDGAIPARRKARSTARLNVIRFPKEPVRRFAPDSVGVVLDFGRWCAATHSGERLSGAFPPPPNTFEAATALAKEMSERDGLRFISSEVGQ